MKLSTAFRAIIFSCVKTLCAKTELGKMLFARSSSYCGFPLLPLFAATGVKQTDYFSVRRFCRRHKCALRFTKTVVILHILAKKLYILVLAHLVLHSVWKCFERF
jgi:hypothetical protein